jgi:hypothetical protein
VVPCKHGVTIGCQITHRLHLLVRQCHCCTSRGCTLTSLKITCPPGLFVEDESQEIADWYPNDWYPNHPVQASSGCHSVWTFTHPMLSKGVSHLAMSQRQPQVLILSLQLRQLR